MSWLDSVPLLTLLTSLVSAATIFLMPEERIRTRTAVNMAGATSKLVLIGVMLWGVSQDHPCEFTLPMLKGVDFVFRADALAIFFVTLSGLLWFLTTIYAIAYLEDSPHRRRFFGFFSLCVSATVGIALAGNLFTFLMFYELLTLTTYPLVVHRETEAARRAGRIYLTYTLGGGALLLMGSVWLHALVPSVDFNGGDSLQGLGVEYNTTLRITFGLIIVGLGVKAALVPLHGWLPTAMIAPAPVSALLHAVAVVKAGAFGIVRVVYDVYGIDRAQSLDLTTPLAIWAAVTIIFGSLRALFQDDLKRRLAYSTISQVSYIVLGVAVVGPASSVGGIVHLVHQGLMKITLFFCAGNLAEAHGIKKVSQMHGVGRRMPLTMTAFTLAALGMVGIPPTIGFISKWYLGIGSIESGQNWVIIVLVASGILNAAYFIPVLYVAWFREPLGQWSNDSKESRWEIGWGLLLPPLVTATLTIVIGLLAWAPFSALKWAVLIVERTYDRVVIDRGLSEAGTILKWEDALWLSALAIPLTIACLLLSRRLSSLILRLAAVAALPALGLACMNETDTAIDLDWFLLHMHLGLDDIGRHFLLFSSLLWLLAGIYSLGYLAADRNRHRYFFWFLLTMTGNLGLILSRDMASFYMFFALMSFSAYPLIIHRGDKPAIRAGRAYMILVVASEAALLAAILYSAVARDSLFYNEGSVELASDPACHLIIGLLLVGFGIKVGIVPLHVWLPLAHPAAPTPASAVLSGAMIKAGLLGWMRFLPLGEVSLPDWGNLWMSVGVFTAFYGVVVGVMQREAKTVLAYSSISQMGLLTIGIGGGLLMHTAWPMILSAVLVFALHHGLCKGCLFLSVGMASNARGTSLHKRLLQTGIAFPVLVLAGAPLTMGAISKSELKNSLAVLPNQWPLMLDVLLPLTSIGTTLLMGRFLHLLWQNTAEKPEDSSSVLDLTSTHAPKNLSSMRWAWVASVLLVMGAPWIVPDRLLARTSLSLTLDSVVWANMWPIGVGCLIAWMAGRLTANERWRNLPLVPAGDIIEFWPIIQRIVLALLVPISFCSKCFAWVVASPKYLEAKENELSRAFQVGESILMHWRAVSISMLVVSGVFVLLWYA